MNKRALWETIVNKIKDHRKSQVDYINHPTKPLPLSLYQQPIYFLMKQNPGLNAYNEYLAVQIRGPLATPLLIETLKEIVRRHSVLRTEVISNNGVASQRDNHTICLDPMIKNVERLDNFDTDAFLNHEINKGFDICISPLVRFTIVRCDKKNHILLMVVHHMIFDAWSFNIFLREVSSIYSAKLIKQPHGLPAMESTYREFVAWSLGPDHAQRIRSQLRYWQHHLEGHTRNARLAPDLPKDQCEPYEGTIFLAKLNRLQTRKLEKFTLKAGTTLFTVLLACFNILLCKYTDEKSMLIGSPVSLRSRNAFFKLIGLFVNTLVMKTVLSDADTFYSFLTKTGKTVIDAYKNQDAPFHQVVQQLNPDRNPAFNPLFQVMFVFQKEDLNFFQLPGLTTKILNPKRQFAKFDLTLSVVHLNNNLTCEFEYNTCRFSNAWIKTFARHFIRLVDTMISAPDIKIANYRVLSPREKKRIIAISQGTPIHDEYVEDIPTLFSRIAAQNPNKEALRCNGNSLTYNELDIASDQIAYRLTKRTVPGDVIGICQKRSIEAIVSMLAILKAGCIYAAIDPIYPDRRIKFIAEDASVNLALLNSKEKTDHLDLIFNETYRVDLAAHTNKGLNHRRKAPFADNACVFYTSGSTGFPKGVMVRQEGLISLVKSNPYIDFHHSHIFSQSAPLGFDASSFEIWGSLLNGATLAIFTDDLIELIEFFSFLENEKITTLWLTTDLFHQIIDYYPHRLERIKQILTGGDLMNIDLVKKASRELTRTKLVVFYGPTENTTFSSFFPANNMGKIIDRVPIGRPLAGRSIYILDRHKQLMPLSAVGEIYVGGKGVCKGYLKRPGLTAERFANVPFLPKSEKLYRTGDLGSYTANNNLLFRGRKDYQIKLGGYRIEPGEVESVVLKHKSVARCVVKPQLNEITKLKRLVAFIEPQSPIHPDISNIKKWVADSLPSYMHPVSYVVIYKFPVNRNGKINRDLLNSPKRYRHRDTICPSTITEEMLAQIWKTLFNMESFNRGNSQIDIHENFFEIGGDSLATINFLGEIEQVFGVQIPFAKLFKQPTISGLSRIIDDIKVTNLYHTIPGVSLIKLREGPGPPLFVIPGGGMARTELLHYPKVIYRLNSCPVYGFIADGLNPKHPNRFTSIQEMALQFISVMKATGLTQPYNIIGDCIGGILALEISSRLHMESLSPHRLVLIDTEYPEMKSDLSHPKVGDDERAFSFMRMVNQYQPELYNGTTCLLYTGDMKKNKLSYSWSRWFPLEFSLHKLPGNHYSYLGKAYKTTADNLNDVLFNK